LLPQTEINNPFHHSTSASFKTKRKITVNDVRIWVNSFSALLKDEEGIACFRKYSYQAMDLNHELEFWETLQSLIIIATRDEFVSASSQIYKLHIAKGSSKEVKSIYTKTRQQLIQQFTHPNVLESLPYDVFYDAEEQVYQLMIANSFERFKTSLYLQEYVKARVKRPKGMKFQTPESLIVRKQ
jgi:hypothetical protein